MKVIYRKLSKLKKLEGNPRKITPEALETLSASLMANKDYFEARPIILSDRTGELVVIAGNQRYEACKQLGWDEVPTVLLSGLTEDREKEIIIRDNVNNGDWDETLLINWDAELLSDWGLDIPKTDDEEPEETHNIYTVKIELPDYEPKNEKPAFAELIDTSKRDELVKEIESAKLDEETKSFLIEAANRHTVFNYEKIADFYANSSKEIQGLMENSALVIIDFNKAIEKGFVKVTKDLEEMYKIDNDCNED